MGSRGVEPSPQEGTQAGGGGGSFQARRALTSEGLPRDWRLTRASDLRAVVRSGPRRRTQRLDISWCANGLEHPRLAVVVPRYGRPVVERNRLRRRIREIGRRRVLPRLVSLDVVVQTRAAAYLATFDQLAADFEQWAQLLPQ
jgi:ribonuclease P protein component